MLLPGCLPEPKIGFNSPAPNKRLDAIARASELEDDGSLVKLVEKLRSLVPTERMLAIAALKVRTGETLGYNFAAPRWQQIEGYNRWLTWLADRGIPVPEGMQPETVPEHAPDGAGDEQPMETQEQGG